MNFYYIVAITCPVPKDIPNGSVTTTGLTYGHFAEYKCKDGYLIDGYQKRRCEADETWAGTPPQCRENCKWYNLSIVINHITI